MPESLRKQLTKLFPSESGEVTYGRHKWRVTRRRHPSKDLWVVSIEYYDRRNMVFYRVWIGELEGGRLRGRFKIKKHPDGFDFTPLRKTRVYELVGFLQLVFAQLDQ